MGLTIHPSSLPSIDKDNPIPYFKLLVIFLCSSKFHTCLFLFIVDWSVSSCCWNTYIKDTIWAVFERLLIDQYLKHNLSVSISFIDYILNCFCYFYRISQVYSHVGNTQDRATLLLIVTDNVFG